MPRNPKTPKSASATKRRHQRMVGRWSKLRKAHLDSDGQWLVWMHGEIHLGTFYCGEFVYDGYSYNETPGMVSEITHVQAVKPPNND